MAKRFLCILLAMVLILGQMPAVVTAVEVTEASEENVLLDALPFGGGFPFGDVSSTDWYYDAVRFAYENNIMQGTAPATFAPYQNFNRAMVITTLFRVYHGSRADYSDFRVNPFHDVPADFWYAPYVT